MDTERWLKLRMELSGYGLLVRHDDAESGDEAAANGRRGCCLVQGRTLQLEPFLVGVGAVWDRSAAAWRVPTPSRLEELAAALASSASSEAAHRPPAAADQGPCLVREGSGDSRLLADRLDLRREPDRSLRRLAELPPEALTPAEILEVLLALATVSPAPQQLAARLLARFGGLGAVLAAESGRYWECLEVDDDALLEGPGGHDERHWRVSTLLKTMWELLRRVLKEEIEDRPVIGSWTALLGYLNLAMQHEPAEHFRILFLDKKNILIRDEVQSRGTVDHTPLYPREVAKRALELAASAIIMVHNHPSGDPTPSPVDVETTRRVATALRSIGIEVHDHIIVGKNRHTSFRTLCLI